MASSGIWRLSNLLPIVVALLSLASTITVEASNDKKVYIVRVNRQAMPSTYASHADWYAASIRQTLNSDIDSSSSYSSSAAVAAADSLLYTYDEAYHGFAASLSPEQADRLRMLDDAFLDVLEDPVYSLHTTRTPGFLGLNSPNEIWYAGQDHTTDDLNQASRNVIIGVLDTGVWPESLSFRDDQIPEEIPHRWKGACSEAPDFPSSKCNRKLIGARSFSRAFDAGKTATTDTANNSNNNNKSMENPDSPRDVEGHGSHTASTAAGAPVPNASLLGYATGTARGVASQARVAVYKVCWTSGCFGSDILAAIEQAIKDGVDVLSLSLGGEPLRFTRDPVAQGAFAAMASGIVVSCSAGNSGPQPSSIVNVAPWILTVGAGTIDRKFPAAAVLGNGWRLEGVSLYSGKGLGDGPVDLVFANGEKISSSGSDGGGGGNGSVAGPSKSELCMPGSLLKEAVKGKLVVCERGINPRAAKGLVVMEAGGVGMILVNTPTNGGEEMVADAHVVPAVAVGSRDGMLLKEYIRTEARPMASLKFGGTVVNVRPAPVVAAFSSRGPSLLVPEILKPDLIGPGVNILAAWSLAAGPTSLSVDKRKTPFNIISGTSMSCPHLSGLAALVRAAHPEWSPSAIKSALMTTAYTRDNLRLPLRDAATGLPANPYAYGSGHVDLRKALSPGLVYDLSVDDYIAFLCSQGYTSGEVGFLYKNHNVDCAAHRGKGLCDFNYPSLSVVFPQGASSKANRRIHCSRQLKSVDVAKKIYRPSVTVPQGFIAKVTPRWLVFRKLGDVKTFNVTFVARRGVIPTLTSAFGSIVWSSGKLQVKSPVVFSVRDRSAR